MLMRRLYLQIYVTIIASLVMVVVLSGLLWSVFGRNHLNLEVFEIAGRLPTSRSPPPMLPTASNSRRLNAWAGSSASISACLTGSGV